jgi:hypothetical protein
MKIRNLSTRAIILNDQTGQRYTIPPYADLDVNSNLWGDQTFRRNLKYRSRDVVINDDTATALATTIVAALSTQTPLSISGATGQTADLIAYKSDIGTVLSRISNVGAFFGPQVGATSTAIGTVPLFAQAASGQTANIFEARNQAATVLVSVTPAGTLQFQGDTTLSRSSAGVLGTSALTLGSTLTAQNGQVGQVVVGSSSSVATLTFGSGADTNLYRASAGALKTDGTLTVAGTFFLGSAGDASIARTAANTLTTSKLTLTDLLQLSANGVRFNDGTIQTSAGIVTAPVVAAGRQLLFGFA